MFVSRYAGGVSQKPSPAYQGLLSHAVVMTVAVISEAVYWYANDVEPAREAIEGKSAQLVSRCTQD